MPGSGDCMEGMKEQELFSWSGGWRYSVDNLEFVVPASHPGEDARQGSSWITWLQHGAETRLEVGTLGSVASGEQWKP